MTIFFQRGPVEEIPRFELNLDRVTISRRSIDSAIGCVRSFAPDLLFTQRDFFTDNGFLMLLSAVNISGSVYENSVYDTWNVMLPNRYAAVVADFKNAYDVGVIRRKNNRDTSECWFGVASVESSVVGKSSAQQGVRISNIVEVEYLPQSISTTQMPSTSWSAKGPGKGKRRKDETPAPATVKSRFEFDDESVVLPKGPGVYFDNPRCAIALRVEDKLVSSRRSGRSCRAAPVF